MTLTRVLRRPLTWVIAVPVFVLLVAVVGPFVYVEWIEGDAPAKLTFEDAPTTTSGAAADEVSAPPELDGKWTVAEGSEAGYRVEETLFGRDAAAVGRTQDVTGDLQIESRSVKEAAFTVDMTTVESDQDRRDRQFHGRIMETSTYPTATFVLTKPLQVADVPGDGQQITVAVTGDFTIHGVKKSATIDLRVRRVGSSFQVQGSVPVAFDDYNIPDPSFGPAVVKSGEMEFLLSFRKA